MRMRKFGLALLLGSVLLVTFFLLPKIKADSQSWYDLSWPKRKPITINNALNPTSLVNHQVEINVSYDSDMNRNFSDLRFTDSGGVTLIPYWVENFTASVSAVVWVKVPSIPASGTAIIYMYYGNSSATSTSNGRTTFEVFDDFENASGWTVKQSMVTPKADATAAVYNGTLYVFGGYSQGSGDARSETYQYDPTTNTWTQKTSMPTARWGLIAVECSGKIYVFSGTGGTNVNEVYDPTANSWTVKIKMPSGFGQGLMAVAYNGKIQLFYLSLHYEYDPATDTYTSKAGMPTPRTWATVAVVNSRIYVIGGYSSATGAATNVNEVYDPTTDTWTTKTPMPIGKYGATRENPVINGKIYVTCGLGSVFFTNNYMYDPTTDTWQQKASATYPRDGVQCGVINNKLYVVGGRADFVGPYGLAYNEEYDPSTDIWALSDASKVYRDSSAKYEGKYGLTINDDNAETEYAERPVGLPTLALDVFWDMTDTFGIATRQPQGRIMLADASYGALYYYNDVGAKFKWYAGTFTTLQAGSWNTWYHVTIIWNGAKSKVIINNAEYSVSAQAIATASKIRLEASLMEMSKMYFDLVRVRKYSSPEPTATLGTEESGSINVAITLQPFNMTFYYVGNGEVAFTAPAKISMSNGTWSFQQWQDGSTEATRSFRSNTTISIIYGPTANS
jgi:hypothetical protein